MISTRTLLPCLLWLTRWPCCNRLQLLTRLCLLRGQRVADEALDGRVLDLTGDCRRFARCHACHLWSSVVNYLRESLLLRPMQLAIDRNLVAASIAYRLLLKPCCRGRKPSGTMHGTEVLDPTFVTCVKYNSYALGKCNSDAKLAKGTQYAFTVRTAILGVICSAKENVFPGATK